MNPFKIVSKMVHTYLVGTCICIVVWFNYSDDIHFGTGVSI